MNSREYFDQIARDYDYWKQKNWYYNANLRNLVKSLIPKGSTVLEIGCGTGDVLVHSEPSRGLGIDISNNIIAIAKAKHGTKKNLHFEMLDLFTVREILNYQFIIMADVLEHLDDQTLFLAQLAKLVKPGTRVIISVANPFWEPVLMLAEKLKLKMPEGPHERLTIKDTEAIFVKSGFQIIEKDYRLLLPKKIFGADWINRRFYKNRFLARLGFIIYWVLGK